MFEPIMLNEFGEFLEKSPNSNLKEDSKLISCIGVHGFCGGFMDIFRISEKYKIIHCRCCHLRMHIPNEIETIDELRKFCSNNIIMATSKRTFDNFALIT